MAGKIKLLKNAPAILKLLSLVTATTAFFTLADVFFNSELRLLSAVTAEILLTLCGFSVERNFTVLSANGMAFDVIQACSGSKSILIILILCVSATFIKNISFKWRVLLISMSIPAAILINSFRVSAIIMVSLVFRKPVEQGTAAHEIIGVISFIITCIIFTVLAMKLSKLSKTEKNNLPLWLTLIVFLLCHVSFFNAGFRDWSGTKYNQDDINSWIFFFSGMAAFWYAFITTENNTDYFKTGALIF